MVVGMAERFRNYRAGLARRYARARDGVLRNRWLNLLVRIIEGVGTGNAGDMAAAISYYALLSLFPLLLGAIALLGLFLPEPTVESTVFNLLQRYLPGTTIDVLRQNIEAVVKLRGPLGAVSVAGLFWSGSVVFGALGRFINRSWGPAPYHPYPIRKARDLALALGTVLLFFGSLGATGLSLLLPRSELGAATWVLGRLLAYLLAFGFLLFAYRFMPRASVKWRDVWPGALIASGLFEGLRSAFMVYLDRYSNLEAVYGSLASVIVFLIWLYASAFIVILGSRIVSEYSRGRVKPGEHAL